MARARQHHGQARGLPGGELRGALSEVVLRSRLGEDYDPAEQLGGAVFFFLRGVANPATHGCYWIAPDMALLDGLDDLLEAS